MITERAIENYTAAALTFRADRIRARANPTAENLAALLDAANDFDAALSVLTRCDADLTEARLAGVVRAAAHAADVAIGIG